MFRFIKKLLGLSSTNEVIPVAEIAQTTPVNASEANLEETVAEKISTPATSKKPQGRPRKQQNNTIESSAPRTRKSKPRKPKAE